MTAYTLPITAHVGEGWSATLDVDQPSSWAGWTAKAQIRYYAGAPTVLVELECDLSTPGEVTVSLPDGATTLLGPITGVWDLLVDTTGEDPQYIAEGPVTITDRVTIPS